MRNELDILIAAARVALEEMRQTIAPRNSFTDAVDALDAALSAALLASAEPTTLEEESTEQPNLNQWTCFHCGETFTTPGSARDHFGGEDAEAGCLIDRVALEEGGKPERGRGLLMALRKAESRIAELARELDSVENDARLWHESEAERRRLQKGRDTSWFMFLDSLEGERLVLAERVKQLAAEPTTAIKERCPVWHRDGYQCQLESGHVGNHKHKTEILAAWPTDERERKRLAELKIGESLGLSENILVVPAAEPTNKGDE